MTREDDIRELYLRLCFLGEHQWEQCSHDMRPWEQGGCHEHSFSHMRGWRKCRICKRIEERPMEDVEKENAYSFSFSFLPETTTCRVCGKVTRHWERSA